MRIIDADALIRDLQERYCRPCKSSGLDYNGVKCKSCQLDDEIDDIDGFADNRIDIDTKRGEWIGTRIGHYPGYECSLCHYGVQPWNTTNFCPNCGARMKGADDE